MGLRSQKSEVRRQESPVTEIRKSKSETRKQCIEFRVANFELRNRLLSPDF